ncbi:MAG: dihydrofolate reductase [Flavobacteriaceae bacterium]
MKKTIVAAYGLNRELGKNNDLIWHLPEDLKHFKNITSGHPIIMGRKTFESIGRPLPKRQNIVISRQENLTIPGCTVVSSLEGAYALLQEESQVFLIGGGQIYKQYLNEVDVLEITEVQQDFEADTFFPKIDLKLWKEVSRIKNKADSKNKFDFDFVRYEKI